jgi:hypothetical protein
MGIVKIFSRITHYLPLSSSLKTSPQLDTMPFFTTQLALFRYITVLTALVRLTASLQIPNPIQTISRDFQALTRKVTAHHILLPKSTDVALLLKQKIRNVVSPKKESDVKPVYIVDAFSSAAMKYSRDEETAARGGKLGTLVPQGYCRAKELDKACFEVPLGEIAGPIESEYGYHLLLVTERINCPKLDGEYSKIVRGDDGVSTKFVRGSRELDVAKLATQQLGFWIAVAFAGGVVAEIAAKAVNIVDSFP